MVLTCMRNSCMRVPQDRNLKDLVASLKNEGDSGLSHPPSSSESTTVADSEAAAARERSRVMDTAQSTFTTDDIRVQRLFCAVCFGGVSGGQACKAILSAAGCCPADGSAFGKHFL